MKHQNTNIANFRITDSQKAKLNLISKHDSAASVFREGLDERITRKLHELLTLKIISIEDINNVGGF